MRKHLAVLAAIMAAAVVTACGNGDGIVINGTTAAQAEPGDVGSDAEGEAGQPDEPAPQESKSGAKIQIITGEGQAGGGAEPGAESLEGQTEYQPTQAPSPTQAPAPTPTQAPTTAAPKAAAASTTAAPTTAAQYEVKDTKKAMYATSSVRVRSSYSTNSEVLGALAQGEKVDVTGESSNGWMRVSYKGHTAYVSKSYLTDTPPATSSAGQSSKPTSTLNTGTTPGTSTGPSVGSSAGTTAGPSVGSSAGTTTGPSAGTGSTGTTTGPGGTSSGGQAGSTGSTGTVTGTVISLDPTGITLQTSDGTSYQFVWGSNVSALSTGEKVQIQYGVDGSGQREIRQVVK